MSAKFYIYRNLTTGGFSLKRWGIVQERFEEGFILDATFKVSEAGNARALKEKSRNVHAYAVSETSPYIGKCITPGKLACLHEVKYNPYRGNHFTVDFKPIVWARTVYFFNGKCYANDIVYK